LLARVKEALPEVRGYAVQVHHTQSLTPFRYAASTDHIQYPANMGAVSWQTGVKDTVNRLNSQNKECPEQKFALVGYSQGAMVIRLAIMANDTKISDAAYKQIVGGATFGDPGDPGRGTESIPFPPGSPSFPNGMPPFPKGLNEAVKINCASGDPV
jgi:hypothetical protein